MHLRLLLFLPDGISLCPGNLSFGKGLTHLCIEFKDYSIGEVASFDLHYNVVHLIWDLTPISVLITINIYILPIISKMYCYTYVTCVLS